MDPAETEAADLLLEGASRLGVSLDDQAVEKFRVYLRLLRAWGVKMNLVSRLEYREIVIAHFLDSLSGYPLLRESEGSSLLDIGSGAGFPSLPLKICLPQLDVSLVESSGKKAAFCEEVIRRAGLAGARVFRARAQSIAAEPAHFGHYQWVVSRAVGSAGKLFAIARPFLSTGGSLLLYKGALEAKELRELERTIAADRAEASVIPVHVPGLDRVRNLLVIRLRPAPGG